MPRFVCLICGVCVSSFSKPKHPAGCRSAHRVRCLCKNSCKVKASCRELWGFRGREWDKASNLPLFCTGVDKNFDHWEKIRHYQVTFCYLAGSSTWPQIGWEQFAARLCVFGGDADHKVDGGFV